MGADVDVQSALVGVLLGAVFKGTFIRADVLVNCLNVVFEVSVRAKGLVAFRTHIGRFCF